jgi:hypothetical protein
MPALSIQAHFLSRDLSMRNLKHPVFMYIKAVLFLAIIIVSTLLILVECPSWKVAGLLMLVIWASARLYYFMFYVIEKYINDAYTFSGIWSFVKYMVSAPKKNPQKLIKKD